MNTLELITEYVKHHVDNPPDSLALESKLSEIGLDSLAVLEMMFEIEEKYDIHLPNNVQMPETVGQLVDLIEKFKPLVVNE
jgi:acyl carrier protein